MRTVRQFVKAQVSAFVASITDYAVTALACMLGGSVALAAFLGTVCGGVLNCAMNYRWAFAGTSQRKRDITSRYFLVWCGSVALNTWGTVLVVDVLQGCFADSVVTVMVARVSVSIAVAVLWNFMLQKYYVFKN